MFLKSLWPEEDTKGKPELVFLPDGSVLAYKGVTCIRWKLVSGGWWATLIMSKSKIALKNDLTIPRLELNGAVLFKRLEEFLVTQLRINFANIYYLVDSSMFSGYLHKQDTKLKPFKGVLVCEIQTVGTFEDGRLLH